jgi:hypothetical protein
MPGKARYDKPGMTNHTLSLPVRSSIAFRSIVLTALLFSACSTGQRVAENGAFQKRKHRLNLARDREQGPERPRTEGRTTLVRLELVPATAQPAEPELLASTSADLPLLAGQRIPTGIHSERKRSIRWAAPTVPGPEQENLMPTKKWNHWAIPAFVAAGTAVGLGFATTSTLVVLIAVVMAIALAAIALRRGRSHELAGKGFALAALMIGMLTAIALAISIAAFGFE